MKVTKKDTKNKIAEDKYTKKQIVNSKTFKENKDLLNALLEENKFYTKNEINEIIKKPYFMRARRSPYLPFWGERRVFL